MPFTVVLESYLAVKECVISAPYHDCKVMATKMFLQDHRWFKMTVYSNEGQPRFIATRS